MISFRDTLSGAFFGALGQPPAAEKKKPGEGQNSKKNKKKSQKKKKKRAATTGSSTPVIFSDEEHNDSDSDDTVNSDIAKEIMMSREEPMSEIVEDDNTMKYKYEFSHLGNPVTMMATKLSKETGILESVVVQHVNVMFEQGRRYDDYDSVLAELNEMQDSDSTSKAKRALLTQSQPQDAHRQHHSQRTSGGGDAAAEAEGRGNSSSTHSGTLHTDTTARTGAGAGDNSAPVWSGVSQTGTSHTRAADGASTTGVRAPSILSGAGAAAGASSAAPAVRQGQGQAGAPVHTAPNSQEEKLDYVAAYSATNLYDSLAALCSWASVTASSVPNGGELGEKMVTFFRSRALEELLATFFSDAQLQLCSRGEVKGALQALLQHVLQLHNDPQGTAYIYYLTEALEELLKQVQELQQQQGFPGAGATGLHFQTPQSSGSVLLAKQVAQCLKELYFHTSAQQQQHQQQLKHLSANGSIIGTGADAGAGAGAGVIKCDSESAIEDRIKALDAQLSSLKISPADAAHIGEAVVGANEEDEGASKAAAAHAKKLFAAREIQLDKLQLLFESLSPGPGSQASAQIASTPVVVTSSAKSEAESVGAWQANVSKRISSNSQMLEKWLLAEGKLNTDLPLSAKHQQSKDLFKHQERLNRERNDKVRTLDEELMSSTARIDALKVQREQLLLQLQLCDQELETLTTHVAGVHTALNETKSYYQMKTQQLNETSQAAQHSAQVHDRFNSLLDAVKNFEFKFADALFCRQQQVQQEIRQQQQQQQRQLVEEQKQQAVAAAAATSTTTTIITSSSGVMKIEEHSNCSTIASSAAAGERKQQALQTLGQYFQTEGQCIGFLARRSAASRTALAAAKKEMAAYQALGMKGKVVQNAERLIGRLEGELSEDSQAARHLQSCLAQAVTRAKAVGGVSKDAVTSVVPATAVALVIRSCTELQIPVESEIAALGLGLKMDPFEPVASAATKAAASTAVPIAKQSDTDKAGRGAATTTGTATATATVTTGGIGTAQKKKRDDRTSAPSGGRGDRGDRGDRQRDRGGASAGGRGGGKGSNSGGSGGNGNGKPVAGAGTRASTAVVDTSNAILQLERRASSKTNKSVSTASAAAATSAFAASTAVTSEAKKSKPALFSVPNVWTSKAISTSASEAAGATASSTTDTSDANAESEPKKTFAEVQNKQEKGRVETE